jgi:hypothetical protein
LNSLIKVAEKILYGKRRASIWQKAADGLNLRLFGKVGVIRMTEI